MHKFLKLNEGYKKKQNHKTMQELLGYAQTEWDKSDLADDQMDGAMVVQEAGLKEGPTCVDDTENAAGSIAGVQSTQTKTSKEAEPSKTSKEVEPSDIKLPISDLGYDNDKFTTFENSKRRMNWQKGRQDWARPSKIKSQIEKVTCETLAEVYVCMRKYGWAILRDLTEVFAPSARFTREQQNFINKCKSQL